MQLISVKCDECEHEFSLNAVDIKSKEVSNLSGVTIEFFTCPKCNKIYRIALKDAQYNELVEDVEKTKKRIRKNFGSNNEKMASMLYEMVMKKKSKIANHIDNLNKKYSGTFTFVASENNHKDEIIYLP